MQDGDKHPEHKMVQTIYNHIPEFWVIKYIYDPGYMTAEIVTYPVLLLANIYLVVTAPIGPFFM